MITYFPSRRFRISNTRKDIQYQSVHKSLCIWVYHQHRYHDKWYSGRNPYRNRLFLSFYDKTFISEEPRMIENLAQVLPITAWVYLRTVGVNSVVVSIRKNKLYEK